MHRSYADSPLERLDPSAIADGTDFLPTVLGLATVAVAPVALPAGDVAVAP